MMMKNSLLLPGATLGVLGGGQLGRMFVQAAHSLGYRVVVLDPAADSPAGTVAQEHIVADYTDVYALQQLQAQTQAVTTEFENVPAPALASLATSCLVAPRAEAVAICQNRLLEKALFTQCGVACAAYAELSSLADVDKVADYLLPGILKTAQLGYDGKGQVRVKTRTELQQAWLELGQVSCILEQWLPLAYEVSVIVARHANGQVVHFPLQHNLHREGILATTTVPAPQMPKILADQAYQAAYRIAAQLDYVGVLCVEFFILQDGRLLANEMAPRPHNSGHYTLDACDVSQFELQVRTLTNLPLVMPRLHSSAVMLNLLGDLWFDNQGQIREPDWAGVLELAGAHLHLYGKTDPRPARKMGHLTITAADTQSAYQQATQAAMALGLALT